MKNKNFLLKLRIFWKIPSLFGIFKKKFSKFLKIFHIFPKFLKIFWNFRNFLKKFSQFFNIFWGSHKMLVFQRNLPNFSKKINLHFWRPHRTPTAPPPRPHRLPHHFFCLCHTFQFSSVIFTKLLNEQHVCYFDTIFKWKIKIFC